VNLKEGLGRKKYDIVFGADGAFSKFDNAASKHV
jgi:hypothetical protein